MPSRVAFVASDPRQRKTLWDRIVEKAGGVFTAFRAREGDGAIVQKSFSLVPVERSEKFLLKPFARPNDELMLRAFGDSPWLRVKYSRLCSAIAGLDVRIFERKDDGALVPLVEDYPMYQIVRRPNPLMFGWEFRFLTELYVRVAGACFWRPIFDGFGVPRQMWIYPAHWVIIIRNPRTWEVVYYDVRQPNGYIERLGPRELLWLRMPDPLNPYFKGLGEAASLATELDTFELASEADRRFFENDATPKGVLVVPGMPTPEEIRRIKDDWKAKMGSPENYGETAVLAGGIEYKSIRESRREMDFIDGQRYLRDVILAGVHPHIVGIAENVNRANAEAAEYTFGRWELAPRVAWWEDVYNTMVAPYFHESVVVKIQDPVPEDKHFKLAMSGDGVRLGVITRNEWRKANGLELLPSEIGDVFLMPGLVNEVPAGQMTADEEQGAVDLPEPSEPGGRVGDIVDPSVGQPYRRPGEGAGRGGGQGGTPGGTPEITPISPTGPAGAQAPVLAQSGPIVQKAKVDRRRAEKILEAFDELEEEGMDEWIARLAAEYLKVIGDRVEDERAELGVGVGFGVRSPRAIKYAEEQSSELIVGINETTREAIREQLAEGIAAGESIRDIAERIRSVFEDAKGRRAVVIARTEVIKASNWAARESYREAGVPKKEWLVAPDYDPEDDGGACEEYDGEIVDVDAAFHDGVEGPPLHVQCRCTVAPVFEEEEEVEEEGKKVRRLVVKSRYADPVVRKARIEHLGRKHDQLERSMRNRVTRLFQEQQTRVLRAFRGG